MSDNPKDLPGLVLLIDLTEQRIPVKALMGYGVELNLAPVRFITVFPFAAHGYHLDAQEALESVIVGFSQRPNPLVAAYVVSEMEADEFDKLADVLAARSAVPLTLVRTDQVVA